MIVEKQALYQVTNPVRRLFGCYILDVMQRFDRVTGERRVTALPIVYENLVPDPNPIYQDPENVIGGRYGRFLRATLAPGRTRAEARIVHDFDLGEPISIGRVELQYDGSDFPVEIVVSGSMDGSNWTLIGRSVAVSSTHRSRAVREQRNAYRYLRVEGIGLWTDSYRLQHIRVIPYALGTSLVTQASEYDLWHNPSYRTSLVISGDNHNWSSFRLWSEPPETALEQWSMVHSEYAIGGPGRAGDAGLWIVYGYVVSIGKMVFRFRDFHPTAPDRWEFGGKIQVGSSSNDPWETVWETNQPITSNTVVDFGSNPARGSQILVVNHYGTSYPAGSRYYPSLGSTGTVLTGAGNGSGALQGMRIIPSPESGTLAPHLTVVTPSDGNLTVSVRNSVTNELVGHPFPGVPTRAGTYYVWWDGRDSRQKTAPAGEYVFDVAFNRAKVDYVSAPGHHLWTNGTQRGFSKDLAATGSTRSLHFDHENNLYIAGAFEEGTAQLSCTKPDGTRLWGINQDLAREGVALATDATHLYMARITGSKREIRRRSRSTGTGETLICTPIASTSSGEPLINGLAVEMSGNFMFVSNGQANRLEVWTKSGTLVNDSALMLPGIAGIALDPRDRSLWITSNNGIGRYIYDENGVFNTEPITLITDRPRSPSVVHRGDGVYKLLGVDLDTSKLREWDVSGSTPVPNGVFEQFGGPLYAGDPMTDRTFNGPFNLAAAPNGEVAISDFWQRRTIWYNADGSTKLQGFREFQTCPRWVPNASSDNEAELICGAFHYQIKLDKTEYEDGFGDKSWRFKAHWGPRDRRYFEPTVQSATSILTLQTPFGPVTYQYHKMNRTGVVIRQVMPDGSLRLAAIVGMGLSSTWRGSSGSGPNIERDYIWNDTNGNGIIDIAPGTESAPSGEVSFWASPNTYNAIKYDDRGSVFLTQFRHDNQNYTLARLDPQFVQVSPGVVNPTFSVSNRGYSIQRISTATSGTLPWLSVDPDQVGGAIAIAQEQAKVTKEQFLAKYNAQGQLTHAWPTVHWRDTSTVKLIACTDAGDGPLFYESGSQSSDSHTTVRVREWTTGLPILSFHTGQSPWGWGWQDTDGGMAVTGSGDSRLFAAMSVVSSTVNVFQLKGLKTVLRDSRPFTWTGSGLGPQPTPEPVRFRGQAAAKLNTIRQQRV